MSSNNTRPGVLTEVGGDMAMLLDLLKGNTVTPIITGDEVEFHQGRKIMLPQGMTYEFAFKTLQRLQKEAETPTEFSRTFKYRPDDGAVAVLSVFKRRYGMVLGKEIRTFFGTNPPETRDVTIGVGKSVQVPWGMVELPTIPGSVIHLMAVNDREYGPVFRIEATAPRKWKDEFSAMFDEVAEELRLRSIYRGKALVGAKELDFYDHTRFDPTEIVLAADAEHLLEGTLWSVIRHTDVMRDEGIPRKRAILLEGPYGTGKTSVGLITAGVCEANGWTFLSARPGRDKIEDVLRTARLYQPAVVFVEDIDNEGSVGDTEAVTRLLEAFDGVTSKGGEVMMVLTTNHLDRIHKGMLRPGRLDAVVHIGELDQEGIARLIRVVCKNRLAPDVDMDAVTEAMSGYYPAFVREAVDRARTFAIAQCQSRDYRLTTEALVGAAESIRPQLAAMHDATEGTKRPALDTAFRQAVTEAVVGKVGMLIQGGSQSPVLDR